MGHIVCFGIGFPFGVAWSPRKWVRNLLITICFLIAYLIIVSMLSILLEGLLPLLLRDTRMLQCQFPVKIGNCLSKIVKNAQVDPYDIHLRGI